jgi:hypothetical protein
MDFKQRIAELADTIAQRILADRGENPIKKVMRLKANNVYDDAWAAHAKAKPNASTRTCVRAAYKAAKAHLIRDRKMSDAQAHEYLTTGDRPVVAAHHQIHLGK